jgi:hypothetical protein
MKAFCRLFEPKRVESYLTNRRKIPTTQSTTSGIFSASVSCFEKSGLKWNELPTEVKETIISSAFEYCPSVHPLDFKNLLLRYRCLLNSLFLTRNVFKFPFFRFSLDAMGMEMTDLPDDMKTRFEELFIGFEKLNLSAEPFREHDQIPVTSVKAKPLEDK